MIQHQNIKSLFPVQAFFSHAPAADRPDALIPSQAVPSHPAEADIRPPDVVS